MKVTKIVSMLVLAGVSFFLGSFFTSRGYYAQQELQRPNDPIEDQRLADIPTNSGIGVIGGMAFVVYKIEQGSPAERMGLQKGDIITRWNGKDIISIRDFLLMCQLEPDQPIKLDYIRANFQTGKHESYTAKGVTASSKSSQ